MVLILQLGRLDLLKLLRQGRHDGTQSTSSRGEVVYTREENAQSCLPSKEEDSDRNSDVEDLRLKNRWMRRTFFFFF